MIEALFTGKYAAYILGAYGITFLVLLSLVCWVWAAYRARRRELAALERAGIVRASARPASGGVS